MQRSAPRATLSATLFLALVLCSESSRADDEAAGRVLFNDAMALANKRQFDEACPKFEESLRQSYNINAHYFLADCWEKQGRTATAWTTFLKVASKAREAGDDKREQAARKRADAVDARLVRLRISIVQDIEGLEVRRNGNPIGRAMWAAVVPVDPGEMEITASAPGYEPFKTTISAKSEGKTVDVTIPALTKLPPAPVSVVSVAPAASTAVIPRPAVSNAPSHHSDGSWRTVGWVAGGVGVAVIAVGGVVALSAKHSFDDARGAYENCQDGSCGAADLKRERDAISRANLATGLVVGGAAAVAAGVVIVIASSGSAEKEPTNAALSLGLFPAAVALKGRF